MLTTLTVLAALFFLAHVFLLFTSFGKKGFQKQKYLWSHITLWLTGGVACVIAVLFAGKDVSGVIDVFNTPAKAGILLLVSLALSGAAHSIVKLLVLPKYGRAA